MKRKLVPSPPPFPPAALGPSIKGGMAFRFSRHAHVFKGKLILATVFSYGGKYGGKFVEPNQLIKPNFRV